MCSKSIRTVSSSSQPFSFQARSGELTIIFLDGSELKVPTKSDAKLEAKMPNSSTWERFSDRDSIPLAVKDKLASVPKVLETLMAVSKKVVSLTSVRASSPARVCIRN